MLTVVIAMFVIVLLAVVVVLYAAYPARGRRLPGPPWLADAMEKATGAMPTLDAEEERDWSLHR